MLRQCSVVKDAGEWVARAGLVCALSAPSFRLRNQPCDIDAHGTGLASIPKLESKESEEKEAE